MRTLWNVGIIISLLFFPWWATAVVIIAGCAVIPRFFEAIFYGILLDALYGTQFGLYGFAYVFTAASVVVFLLATVIRKKVIW